MLTNIKERRLTLYKTLHCKNCKKDQRHIWCLSKEYVADKDVLIYACMECAEENKDTRKLVKKY